MNATVQSIKHSDDHMKAPWQARYGRRHGFVRLRDDPSLVDGRRGRVTIYQRGHNGAGVRRQTFILAWCSCGRRRKERIIGDRHTAIRRADEINEGIALGGPTPTAEQRELPVLVRDFVGHLEQRSEAGEISPRTPTRYRNALQHLIAYASVDKTIKDHPSGWIPTRDLALRFKAFLHGRVISPNGHEKSRRRTIAPAGMEFILGAARALVQWAVHTGRLPAGSTEAFIPGRRHGQRVALTSERPLTTEDVVALIRAADLYQLALISFHLFHGARVTEPCWTMIEDVDTAAGWIEYRGIPELGYRTKGGTNKRLPIPPVMTQAIEHLRHGRAGGPVILRRRLIKARAATSNSSLQAMIHAVQHRTPANWAQRVQAGEAALRAAGGIGGDDVRREFSRLARAAGLPKKASPKALRHHFATAMEAGGVPYYTRRYLLGHTVGGSERHHNDATAHYTHLEPGLIRAEYDRLLHGPLAPVAAAFAERFAQVAEQRKPQSAQRRSHPAAAS